MRSEKREVYVSDDGKVFDTVEACQAHERQTAANAKRIEGLKVYKVISSFDSTEGRGYHRHTYIITDASFAVVLEYCLDRFGKPLAAWYGDGFYEQWIINQSDWTAETAIKRAKEPHSGVGSTRGEADVVFLSGKDIEHPELPSPVYPWPKRRPRPCWGEGMSGRAEAPVTYWHGGPRGLREILPPIKTGKRSIAAELDPAACLRSKVYVTTEYGAAVLYASVIDKGTVYRVEPVGEVEHDPDCRQLGLSYQCDAARVICEVRPKGKHLRLARKALAT
ncbi:hypothetical protein [Aureimonas populi]|uniref:Uncharacterized protein n=1 Tax=Aureimonas populi TaxID=1701758 RepID=A0ABW5CF83_9HYPH|nr:hypothetical protein [Aureimonas populi]